jgi:CheY-like chemotaxis protein
VSTVASRTILCIDDDRGALDYHRALLERHGYQVLTASSGRKGIEIVRDHAVTAVIVDYHMPEMNGDEVAVALKRIKPSVPVVMVSSDNELPDEVLSAVDAFISKNEVVDCLLPALTSFFPDASLGLQEPTAAG